MRLQCDVSKTGNFTLIPHLFSKEECHLFVTLIDNTDDVEHLRTRARLISDSHEWADRLWKQLKPWIFANGYGEVRDDLGDLWECSGINGRFRLVKYEATQDFRLHEDGYYEKSWDERSFATFMVYLNDVPEECGGATFFTDHSIRIQPREGLCVVFFVEGLMHCGEMLKAGEKYILRTDFMYRLKEVKDPDMRKAIYQSQKAAENSTDKPSKEWKHWAHYYELREKYLSH
jgi:hypothetical protein